MERILVSVELLWVVLCLLLLLDAPVGLLWSWWYRDAGGTWGPVPSAAASADIDAHASLWLLNVTFLKDAFVSCRYSWERGHAAPRRGDESC